jgi:membrane protease YdiL (CAAX protease family)
VSPRARAAWALLLLVPAPTLGALAAFAIAPGPVGQALYGLAKLWIALLPLVWVLAVERARPSLRFAPVRGRARAWLEGLAVGLALGAGLLLLWSAGAARLLDVDGLRATLARAGVTGGAEYLFVAVWITLVNSALEEYVWRWFVGERAARLVGPRAGVPLAAACFTLHHVVVFGLQGGATFALIGGAAVFGAGCLWSWLVARHGALGPTWLSHALVDAAGLWIGWELLT